MGENEGWAEPVEPLPNGLLPRAGPVMRALDAERWMKAEKRTAELIACIQPNKLSEERRNAVADYVQRLIMKCFPCQVCTFGSVPLKTYLPDGDIDLTAFSQNPNLRDTWANQVRDMLSSEEKNENAEFHVKEVQYIQAEVPLIKCLVENIVVDISFNQVGGLCTLCFLDEVDILINQNHLFKRSIILIKAWCYYESRILGAHHGLISTYALETLVLYIFHVFNNSFHGPLEVLYHFLEFFSNFDWDNFCVSLWGPVPIKSLPDVTAESPRKDSQELLLSKLFLDACSTVYAVFPGGQENNGQQFVPKNFNVIDPLRSSNNLGRSVNRGNFFRIRSAFAFGAKKLARLLDCPKENVNFEVNQFFMNTWERHGSGNRPDAPGVDLRRHLTSSTPDRPHEFQNSNWKKAKENSNAHGLETEGPHTHDVSYQHVKTSSRMMPMENELYSASLTQNLKSQFSLSSIQSNDQIVRDLVPNQVVPNDKIQRDMNADHLVSDGQRRFTFARTHSSPELTDNYSDTTSQVQFNRHGGSAGHATYSTADFSNRWRNLGSETRVSHGSCSSVEDTVARNVPSSQRIDAADSTSCKPLNEEFPTSSGAQLMHQEEQDIVNMMASASFQGYNGQVHLPINLTSGHLPYSIPPFLASMGYGQQNFPGFVPTNYPLLDPSFSHVQFPHGLVSPQLTQYFPGVGLNASEDSVERGNDFFCRVDSREAENEFPVEHEAGSSCGYDPEYGNLDSVSSDDKVPASLSGLIYVPPPSRGSGSSVAWRVQQRHPRERHGAVRENIDGSSMHDNRSSELYVEDKSARPSSASHSNSMRSRTSSEGSWDGSSVKGPKTTKEKRGKRMLHTDPSVSHGKGKTMSEHMSNDTDDDDQDWGSLSNMTETIERNSGSEPDAPLHVSRHPFSGFEVAQTSGSDSMVPFAPMLLGSGSGQRMNDNSGLIAFYPTGPPIPFLTMLPVYNIPPKTGTSEASSGHFGGHETLGNSESLINIISKGSDTSEELTSSSSLRGGSTNETSEEQKTDILNSDFASHLQSLQIGRVCQNLRYQGPLIYPSPVMVPPIYIQGRLPYDNPGRPLSSNINVFSQLVTNYGQRLVPVAPIQSVSSRQPNIYQSYVDDMPRYRSGTGTYLPNPKIPVRERHSSGSRRGNYNHDRNDNFGDREGKGNANSKSRAAARSHNRSQSDKSNSRTDRFTYSEGRADRVWNSNRHNSIPSYQSQNGQFRSNTSQNGPQNVAYNMYPLAAMNPNEVSNGPSVPPLVMLYPFDNNATYGSHSEQLEFGSLGPVGFPDINELSQLYDGTRARAVEDHRLHGSSVQRSSPDQPSSPHHLRRV